MTDMLHVKSIIEVTEVQTFSFSLLGLTNVLY